MKENSIIDVDYEELENNDYYTIEEAAKKLSLAVEKVIFYCNKFENLLNINSIGQFKVFSKEDLRNLQTIKELNIDKNMNISEIKQYLSQNGTAIIIKKENELDMSVFKFFTNIIENQNEKINKLVETQSKSMKMFAQLYNEVTVDNENKNKLLNKIVEEQHSQQQNTSKLEELFLSKITIIEDKIDKQELDAKKHDLEMLDMLKQGMKDKENRGKGGWLGRIFK